MVDFSFFYSIILLLFLQEFFDPLFFKKVGGGWGDERDRPQCGKQGARGVAAVEISASRDASKRNFGHRNR